MDLDIFVAECFPSNNVTDLSYFPMSKNCLVKAFHLFVKQADVMLLHARSSGSHDYSFVV